MCPFFWYLSTHYFADTEGIHFTQSPSIRAAPISRGEGPTKVNKGQQGAAAPQTAVSDAPPAATAP